MLSLRTICLSAAGLVLATVLGLGAYTYLDARAAVVRLTAELATVQSARDQAIASATASVAAAQAQASRYELAAATLNETLQQEQAARTKLEAGLKAIRNVQHPDTCQPSSALRGVLDGLRQSAGATGSAAR